MNQAKKEYIPYLDGWRGLAIALVLFSHFIAGNDMGADYGRLGVDIFFALSGMLMSGILFKKETPLSVFYRRRISRIVPAFLVFVLIVYGVGYVFGNAVSIGAFLSTLIFLRTYFPSDPDIWHTGLPIAHLWSLNVEEHCYLLMGLWAYLPKLRKHAAKALLTAGMGALLIQIFYMTHPHVAPALYSLRTETASAIVFFRRAMRFLNIGSLA